MCFSNDKTHNVSQKYDNINAMKYFLVIVSLVFFFNPIHAQNKSGCVSGTCTNGKGTYVYPSGARYSGDWVNKLPYGRGILTSRDGNIFSGDIVKGLKNGKGKMEDVKTILHFPSYISHNRLNFIK